ncbi:NADPH:quinone oxidoreductase family protein [Phenylobacterium sp.]|uniref:NADPH:quinone oxidoreductase family protein n=1 Tax=Phenylobacterium sp. TaxID=1871053 RepID=UPI002737A42C|nr:NADPH:quinone oxidoreductase family protein [Phenylobacterium sp.]MDP3867536.1 NADPH:quinone oxidoreductase family protein [Phenylobacterium sp.]
MKAVLSVASGGPETLVVGELPDPAPGAGEVVVRMRACGVNFPDTLMIVDKYQFKPQRPFSPGGEFAGEIEAVGEGVGDMRVGDRVIGLLGWGGMAEKVAVPRDKCVPMPASMSFEDGAAFLATYGTSHHALKQRGRLQAGETLLVLGAAGGVGLAAVELGKVAGARVVAAVSSQEKADLALSRGADSAVIYPREAAEPADRKALAQLFKEACGEAGADVVYDAVGGGYAEAALRAIAWRGRLLVVGFPAGIPQIPLNLALLKGCEIVGVFYGAFAAREPEADAENLRELMALYESGRIRPHVSMRYGLADAGLAIAALGERRALGKIVVVAD